ncbi:hypothetical protein [Brevundimonas balnearis]|uniref:Uncharacterized protein n=1 Tax=Brevundimonas balnearis TaxID=1572858 RepID=A0ABV6R143_9CAUL
MLMLTIVLAASAVQQPETGLEPVLRCRSVVNEAERLACYDQAATALEAAQRQGEIRVIDRAGLEASRRSLFGFPDIQLGQLFGSDTEPLQALEAELDRAVRTSDGKWNFILSDGSQWRQLDSDRVSFSNRNGEPVRVRRGALGSYLMTIGGSRAVRVRRW